MNSQTFSSGGFTVHIWCTERTHSQNTFIQRKLVGFALAEDKPMPMGEKVLLLPLLLHLDRRVYSRMLVLHLVFNHISSTAESGISSFHEHINPSL